MTKYDDNNAASERGVVLFSNRKYMFALGAFLINLKKYVRYDGIFVYHDGFTTNEQDSFKKIDQKIKFIKYGVDEFAKEFDYKREKLTSEGFFKRYTVLAAVKFKIFQHLEEFSTIIMFDLDMLLQDGMDDLLEKNFDIAWRNDGQTIRDKLRGKGCSDELFRELGMYDTYDKTLTPNGGFVVLKRTFDYQNAYAIGAEFLKKYSFLHPFNIDEILFGYIGEKMGLNVYWVDEKIYNVWPNHVSIRSKLIHFMGDYKPWNCQTVQAVFKDWKINYYRYVSLTGMTSSAVVDFDNISECLLQANSSKKWDELFFKYGFIYSRELKLVSNLSNLWLVFSYYGIITYKIETDWWTIDCWCTCWLDKNNKCLPIRDYQIKLRGIAEKNQDFVSYYEDGKRFGLRTIMKNLRYMPDFFYRLYVMTEELRKTSMTCYAKLKTYHGSKLYVDIGKRCIKHDTEEEGEEVYAEIKGNKIALYINAAGMNVYFKGIGKNGEAWLSSQQTYLTCIHNHDHSISIEVEDGILLSADKNNGIVLRNWNREWEHFSVQMIGRIME